MDNTNGSPLPEAYGALDEPGGLATGSPTPAEGRSSEVRPSDGFSSDGGSPEGDPDGSPTDRPGGGTFRERLGRTVGQYSANGGLLKRLTGGDRPSATPDSNLPTDRGTDAPASQPWTGAPLTSGSNGADAGSRSRVKAQPTDGDSGLEDSPGDDGAERDADFGAPAVPAGVSSAAQSGLSASPTPIPFVASPSVPMISPELARAPTEAIPLPRRTTRNRRGGPGTIAAPTTSRVRPESRSQEEPAHPLQPTRGWRRQKVRVIRSTSSRRMIRRLDTWTVFKVSLIFYLLGLAILLVAGVILWNVATTFGTIASLQKSIRSLFALNNFQLRPRPLLEYSAAAGIILALLGTIMNTVAALLYNLISDIIGGIQIVVVTEPD